MSEKDMDHLKTCRTFYESDYFKLLTCGAVADGADIARRIIRRAMRRTRAEVET